LLPSSLQILASVVLSLSTTCQHYFCNTLEKKSKQHPQCLVGGKMGRSKRVRFGKQGRSRTELLCSWSRYQTSSSQQPDSLRPHSCLPLPTSAPHYVLHHFTRSPCRFTSQALLPIHVQFDRALPKARCYVIQALHFLQCHFCRLHVPFLP
jgi:hypothetical protein